MKEHWCTRYYRKMVFVMTKEELKEYIVFLNGMKDTMEKEVRNTTKDGDMEVDMQIKHTFYRGGLKVIEKVIKDLEMYL